MNKRQKKKFKKKLCHRKWKPYKILQSVRKDIQRYTRKYKYDFSTYPPDNKTVRRVIYEICIYKGPEKWI